MPVPPPSIDADTLDGLDSSAFERRRRYELPFAWGDASPRLIVRVPAGQLVLTADLTVLVPFDGVGSQLAIGTAADPDALLSPEACLPDQAGSYAVTPNLGFPAATDILLTITPGDLASQGSGVVAVTLS